MAIKRRMQRKRPGKILARIMLVFTLMAVLAGLFGWRFYNIIFGANVDLGKSGVDYLYIPSDASFDDVVDLLTMDGWLIDASAFEWVAEQKGYSDRIRSGRFEVRNRMSNNALVNLLRSGKQAPVNVTFNNIRTKEQLAGVIHQRLEADSAELVRLMNDASLLGTYQFDVETALAMFIPNTYQMYWNTDAAGYVKRMAKEYQRFWNAARKEKAEAAGLTPLEVSILAAIVDEETIKEDEKPLVAGLYINRLKKGIRLQADPTVKYAIGDFTVNRILNKDLETDSPYNTYLYAGLPPGPIRIPSIQGIEAVLNHSKHKYLYMCAKDDFSGYHNFAKTLKQHNVNAAKYRNALRKKRIYR
ncbi:endolytic transglycosylase MltG [Marinilabiliaceae bacterium JC017]|nr:endolytic transglycosylase MltG [Marinilabiliaceae bacterium JC017]